MNSVAFIDIEVDPASGKTLDIGSVKDNGNSFHKTSVAEFIQFLDGTHFICGNNIFNHDLKYIDKAIKDAGINSENSKYDLNIHYHFNSNTDFYNCISMDIRKEKISGRYLSREPKVDC